MVNSGGPSKGCLTCIRRKVRCDRQRPVCGQCQKGSRSCGYRDETDFIFRDQSQDTIVKSQTGPHRQISPKRNSIPTEEAGFCNVNVARPLIWCPQDTPPLARPPTPPPDPEYGFIDFLTRSFICVGPAETVPNHFCVPHNFNDLLKNESTRLSAHSLGALFLARLQRSTDLHRYGQRKYSEALLSLAEQWRDQPEEVDKDHTLLTVCFLSFSEALVSFESLERPFSTGSWMTHLRVVGSLIQRRGQKFVDTEFGAQMLLQMRRYAIVGAFESKQPVMDTFQRPLERSNWLLPNKFKPVDEADQLLIRLADLQARATSSSPSSISSAALVTELIALDSGFRAWMRNVPPSYAMPPHQTGQHSASWWDVRYDVYPSLMASAVWNKVRTARLIIHGLIQDPYLSASTRSVDAAIPDSQTAELRRMVADICSTVPPCYRPPFPEPARRALVISPIPANIFWLFVDLETVGCWREAPLTLTIWVLQCLERMHEMHNFARAQIAAGRVKKRLESCLSLNSEA